MRAALVFIIIFTLSAAVPAGEELTLNEADNRLAIASRLLEGGIYPRAGELALSVLDAPEARAVEGEPEAIRDWLMRREAARFMYYRSLYGQATERQQFQDLAEDFLQLANNRYLLPEPAYNVQAAYWAGRSYESADLYGQAVDMYGRVGGLSLPQGMEGDAAQRMSRNLRLMAEEIPFPGTQRDRQRRDQLLNQAIAELDRARLAFPIGERRKEIELDLIALRLARRDEQYVREAATEAEAYIAREAAKDALRARAVIYRARAAALLGESEAAANWYRRAVEEEEPEPEDAREAELGLALALGEMANSQEPQTRMRMLAQAAAAMQAALADAPASARWDGVRVILAETLLELQQPTAALEALYPTMQADRVNHQIWQTAGTAELRRGRLTEALEYLYPATRPTNPQPRLRLSAARDAAYAANVRRDYGIALALNHQASRMLRSTRLYSSLMVSEFQAMEILLRLGRASGPVSLSGDVELMQAEPDASALGIAEQRDAGVEKVAEALGRLLAGGGDADTGYDLATEAEAAINWSQDGMEQLELALAMIRHLSLRKPQGVTDSALASSQGEARQALALARAEKLLGGGEPSDDEVGRILADFAAAAESYQAASAGGLSSTDSLDQGMVNMESGAFLMRLAERWERGEWSSRAMMWREEARLRIEASLRPFNQTIATSGGSSLAARRARWSRGRALELLGEYRPAAADYLSLMNNSELPRVVRANAARRWAQCMDQLGETRQAMLRLAVFADNDAESALLDGKLAEKAGIYPEAYTRYVYAANPDAPALPPHTPWRSQEAAYLAGRLALVHPSETRPRQPPAETVEEGRQLLERAALEQPKGAWTIPMLGLLGENLLGRDENSWRQVHELAVRLAGSPEAGPNVRRSMLVLSAKALSEGGEQEEALDQLDNARDIADSGPAARATDAAITLETARIFRKQSRPDDALRAYADVFAIYPEAVEMADAARLEAAEMLLTRPEAGEVDATQARSILSGVRDQTLADDILRRHGLR